MEKFEPKSGTWTGSLNRLNGICSCGFKFIYNHFTITTSFLTLYGYTLPRTFPACVNLPKKTKQHQNRRLVVVLNWSGPV